MAFLNCISFFLKLKLLIYNELTKQTMKKEEYEKAKERILATPISEIIEEHNEHFNSGRKYNPCPFCGSSDAFSIHKAKNIFKCFSCGVGGNAFSYIMRSENCDFRTAFDILCFDAPMNDDKPFIPKPKKEPVYYDFDLVKRCFKPYLNNLIQYLSTFYDKDDFDKVLADYWIGSSSDNGNGNGVVFWQIDEQYRVRKGKVMYYGTDGHRLKYIDKKGVLRGVVSSVKNELKKQGIERPEDTEPEMCYFGLHLINKYPDKPIGIVESEKTAIIASMVNPDYLWLATGGASNFTANRTAILKDRELILFPDVDHFEDWSAKANDIGFKLKTKIEVNDFVIQNGTGKQDIADILLGQ